MTASAHTAPAIAPTAIAPSGETEEHEGVMATSPATTPEAPPRLVGRPSRIRSTSNQASMAVQVATAVLMKVMPATPFAATADPALNPNHPNHRREAPIMVSGRLPGAIASRLEPAAVHARPAFTVATRHFDVLAGPVTGQHCDIVGELYTPVAASVTCMTCFAKSFAG